MRIRTLKPAFFNGQEIKGLSRDSRLTLAGLLLEANDWGIGNGDRDYLRAMIYPYDGSSIRMGDLEKWLDELAEKNLAYFYNTNNQECFCLPTFTTDGLLGQVGLKFKKNLLPVPPPGHEIYTKFPHLLELFEINPEQSGTIQNGQEQSRTICLDRNKELGLRNGNYKGECEGETKANLSLTFSVFSCFYPKQVKGKKLVDAMTEWSRLDFSNGRAAKVIQAIANQVRFNKMAKIPNPDTWLKKQYWGLTIDALTEQWLMVEQYCWMNCVKDEFDCKECGQLWKPLPKKVEA